MSNHDFLPFAEKMRAAHVMEPAIRAFERNYHALRREETGTIRESDIQLLENLDAYSGEPEAFDPDLLSQTVIIKLNGGLGTSMGLEKAKTLLEVRPDTNFLDLIVRQVESLRASTNSAVQLLLMNSFSTSDDTLNHLKTHAPAGYRDPDEIELMQNQAPKIDAATLQPVRHPTNPDLEWCPPGHGDIYPALLGSGWLDKLLDRGIKFAFVSNSDNLGATLSAELLRRFAESDRSFLMEVTRRTESDRKGGHLAQRRADGQLLLREVAQCNDADLDDFQNIERHQFFNTNSIWLRLDRLKAQLEALDGVLPLPMIRNRKTVDPRNPDSTPVLQLETAMGAAIECFDDAWALEVPRTRFAPVKTTADLFALRSDAYHIDDDGRVSLIPERHGKPPKITLDPRYKLIDSLESLGMPSLAKCQSLNIQGEVSFADGVEINGHASYDGTTKPVHVTP